METEIKYKDCFSLGVAESIVSITLQKKVEVLRLKTKEVNILLEK